MVQFFSTVLMPFYLEDARGLTPGTAGTLLSLYPLMMVFFAPFGGWLADKWNVPAVALLGSIFIAVGSLIGAALKLNAPLTIYIISTLLVSCSEKSAWHRWQFQCARTQSWDGQRHGGCDNSALWHDESTCWQPRNELSNSTSRILYQRFTSCHDCRCCARYSRSHRHRPDNQTVAGTRKKLVSVFMTVHPSEHLIFQ